MDMRCGAWPPRSAAGEFLMYTSRRHTNFYIRSERRLGRMAPPRAGAAGTGLCGSLHLYPVPQHVVLPDRGGTALRGNPRGTRGRYMQDLASELPRILLP